MPKPLVSVVISNQNGTRWLPRCFEALRQQTIWDRMEVVLVDNCSTDDSVAMSRREFASYPCARVIVNPQDLGFTGGNNVGVEAAQADWIFFLSNDTHLEPDCIETIVRETEAAHADAASPLVLNYDARSFQCIGSDGLDWMGIPTESYPVATTTELFTITGCGFLMRRELFLKIGGFDTGQFMYTEDTDLSWRIWIAGGRIVGVPAARMHHRAALTPRAGGQGPALEARTTDTKRFLSNRNGILFILKNAQHVLLLLLLPHLMMLVAEMAVSLVLIRRWSHVRKAYLSAITGAFAMLGHVRQWRRRIAGFRQRSDFSMLRFLRLKPSRWEQLKRLRQVGLPVVEAR